MNPLLHYFLRFSLLILLTVAITSCQSRPEKHQDSFIVFGTVVNVTLLNIDNKKAVEAFRRIREDLNVMHRVWHVWEPSSLMRMNQLLETTVEFTAAPSVLELVHVAKELAIKSDHLFNPAIGKLIGLWGFHSHHKTGKVPTAEEISKLVRQAPTMEDIIIRGVRMRSRNPAVKLDFGGVAKGYAIERIVTYLKSQNINHALIDTGGDLKVIGKHFDRPWKVAIRDPRARKETAKPEQNNKIPVIATVTLNGNEAAFTSGDYERFIGKSNKGGQFLHHIIDPRTGYPAKGTQSVTVIHDNAATADAAATALFIAGPQKWVKIAKSMGIKYILLVDQNGKIHISSVMLARIKFLQDREIVEQVTL